MQLSRSGLDIGHVADLGIRAASASLAKPMPETDEPDADAEPEPAYDFGIPINDVKFVRECCPRRSGLDLEWVRELAEFLGDLPPIEVNQHNELIDGRHRWEAHKACGMRRIRVIVTHTDDRLHILKLALKRNSSHGIPFNRADRQLQAERESLDAA
jgi:ParB-like nuclease domain